MSRVLSVNMGGLWAPAKLAEESVSSDTQGQPSSRMHNPRGRITIIAAGTAPGVAWDALAIEAVGPSDPQKRSRFQMLLHVKRWLARRLHRILGADAIRDEIRLTTATTTRHLLTVVNAQRYAAEPAEVVRARPEYRRCAETVALLAPRLIEGMSLVRVGGANDGGYVMLDSIAPPTVAAAYSFGVGSDVSWDAAIAARGVDVYLYDHTVTTPPALPPRCRFTQIGISGAHRDPRMRTLAECISLNGHAGRNDLLLKMDVEGAEWEVLEHATPETLGQFHQIVIELHELGLALDAGRHDSIMATLRKLSHSHQPVHVHANCMHVPIWIGDIVLPPVLEVTYVRRRDVAGRIGGPAGPFPTAIDQPNVAGWPDVYLGWFGGSPVTAASS
jgi:hypothetical protein